MPKEIEVDEELLVDNAPHLEPKAEQYYREVIRAECDLVSSGARKRDIQVIRAMRWACQQMVTALGHGDIAIEILQDEIETYERKLKTRGVFGNFQAGMFDATMRRVMIPGNSYQARANPG